MGVSDDSFEEDKVIVVSFFPFFVIEPCQMFFVVA